LKFANLETSSLFRTTTAIYLPIARLEFYAANILAKYPF